MSGGDWKEMYNAAVAGDMELLSYHVRSGVDVNYAHPEFLSTPLVGAILARRSDAALYLLEHGADPTLRSEFDAMTPMQASLATGLSEVTTRLRALGVAMPDAAPDARPSTWFDRLLQRGGA